MLPREAAQQPCDRTGNVIPGSNVFACCPGGAATDGCAWPELGPLSSRTSGTEPCEPDIMDSMMDKQPVSFEMAP